MQARAAKLRWQTATVVAVETRTPTVKSFFFRLAQPLTFIAGQHMDVRLTAPDGYQAQRSYSIASAPETTDRLELAIELLQDGEVSPFFHDTVAVGDEIELRGPIGGHFMWSVKTADRCCSWAAARASCRLSACSGIAPRAAALSRGAGLLGTHRRGSHLRRRAARARRTRRWIRLHSHAHP